MLGLSRCLRILVYQLGCALTFEVFFSLLSAPFLHSVVVALTMGQTQAAAPQVNLIEGDAIRVVLVGKTGAGKSTLGNTLAGLTDKNQQFKVGRGINSETVNCDWRRGGRCGVPIEITDTPGLCDTHLKEGIIYREVAKSIAVAEPGPHLILFVLRCDRRFTNEENAAYVKIKEMFSEDMKKHLILVFNGLDTFHDEFTNTTEAKLQSLKQDLDKSGHILKDILEDASGRYMGISKHAPQEHLEEEMQQLVNMMMGLVKQNEQAYYHTSLTQRVNERVEELILKEAETKGKTRAEAEAQVKQDIIDNKVDPGFLDVVSELVTSAAQKVKDMASACRLM